MVRNGVGTAAAMPAAVEAAALSPASSAALEGGSVMVTVGISDAFRGVLHSVEGRGRNDDGTDGGVWSFWRPAAETAAVKAAAALSSFIASGFAALAPEKRLPCGARPRSALSDIRRVRRS